MSETNVVGPLEDSYGVLASENPSNIDPMICGFCGRDRFHVARLLAGATAFICTDCIAVAVATVFSDQFSAPKDETP